MKKSIILLFAILVTSCSGQKNADYDVIYNKGLVYILPDNIIELLSEKTQINEKIYFVIDVNKNDDEYTIILINYISPNEWIKNTNRYIAIKGKLFPLILGSDFTFANIENASEYLKKYNNGIIERTKRNPIFDNVNYITFKKTGEILYKQW